MQPYEHLKPEQIGGYMSENLGRIKRILQRTPDKVERWNYIMEECPDTQWGIKMIDNLLVWARANGGIERPKFGTSLSKLAGKIGRE